jgi:hypothetical protein
MKGDYKMGIENIKEKHIKLINNSGMLDLPTPAFGGCIHEDACGYDYASCAQTDMCMVDLPC